MRWPTETDDLIEDQDTFKTEIDDLAEMCDNGSLSPLDVLGIALVADNEIVKNERIIKSQNRPNSFDYDENRVLMYTEIESSLISVGFQNTEIVPYNSTPLPDDYSPAMSLTARYGGSTPRVKIINSDDEAVCVKTTRWGLKQHTHLSPTSKVNGHVFSNTATSLAGVNYMKKHLSPWRMPSKSIIDLKLIRKIVMLVLNVIFSIVLPKIKNYSFYV